MWKRIAVIGIATLTLAACSDDRGTYVYRPPQAAALGGASQGNAANDELHGGLPAGAEVGGGANAGPRISSAVGVAPAW